MQYFSEKETGEAPRVSEEIADNVWIGISAAIRICVKNGSFGVSYPNICADGTYVTGTNEFLLDDAMRAEFPGLAAHVAYVKKDFGGNRRQCIMDVLHKSDIAPSTLDILDLIEFCWKSVGEPRSIDNHSFLQHQHLEFDVDAGREKFRNDVERIFRRNGIAYTSH